MDFKICVAGMPAELAQQVSVHLAEGWELHGSPFVELQFATNGHGPEVAGNRFCQALVRPAPKQPVSAAPAAPLVVEKPRTITPASFQRVAGLLGALLIGYLLADVTLFRSGFYTRFLEPESSTGSFERTFKLEKDRPPTGKKEVLLVGSSRVAEGFSAKLANSYKPEDGYRFFNCSVPSSGARVFYYEIRDLDPKRNRYAAIAIPIDDFDDPDDVEDPADRTTEIRMLVNRLRWSDIIPYTMSFSRPKSRREVLRGALFKGTIYQLDLADFIENPTARLARVHMFDENHGGWAYDYAGIAHSMAGLSIDFKTNEMTFPADMPPDAQNYLRSMYFSNPPQRAMNRAFEVRWLGALAELYRNSKTRLVLYQTPRGPVHKQAPKLPWTSIDVLRKYPDVSVIDGHRFEALERPELFGDHVHLNIEGRKTFTPQLVDALKEIVH